MKKTLKLFGIFVVIILMSSCTPNKIMTIVIDAGHGGKDNGAEIQNTFEKDITLSISKRMKELNNNDKIEIVLLRDNDEFTSLSDRVKKINEINPDLLISLHLNSNNDTNENGIEIFVSKLNSNYEKSKEIAETLINATYTKLKNRGINEANFLILKDSNCPAIAIELGFITNINDKEYLESENGQNEIAELILNNLKK